MNLPFNLKEIGTTSLATKSAVIVGVGLILCIIIFFFFTNPQYQRLTTARQQTFERQQQLSALEPKVAAQKQRTAEINALQDQVTHYGQALPKVNQLNTIVESLARLASNQQLNLILLKPKENQSEPFYTKVPIEIKVAGTYAHIAQFIDQMAHMDYYVYLNTLDVRQTTSLPSLTMGLTAELYYLTPATPGVAS